MDRVGRVLDDWRMGLCACTDVLIERNCDDVAKGVAGEEVVLGEIREREGWESEGRGSRCYLNDVLDALVLFLMLFAIT